MRSRGLIRPMGALHVRGIVCWSATQTAMLLVFNSQHTKTLSSSIKQLDFSTDARSGIVFFIQTGNIHFRRSHIFDARSIFYTGWPVSPSVSHTFLQICKVYVCDVIMYLFSHHLALQSFYVLTSSGILLLFCWKLLNTYWNIVVLENWILFKTKYLFSRAISETYSNWLQITFFFELDGTLTAHNSTFLHHHFFVF